MFINHTSKEVTAKIVYYGPGLSGKTTNLQHIFSITNSQSRGELVSIETEIERTLFFDLLPINVGLIKGYRTKFQLYTVPGQIFYNSTRKLVLKGADGIVFTADSQDLMEKANLESLENLKTNLSAHQQKFEDLPIVFQYNKRDLSNILSVADMNKIFNRDNHPYFESIAIKGTGVVETLREISNLTLQTVKKSIESAIEDLGSNKRIEFDLNEKKKVKKLEDLPLKKISAQELTDPMHHNIVKDEFNSTATENIDLDPISDFEEDTAVTMAEQNKKKQRPAKIEKPAEPAPYPVKEKIHGLEMLNKMKDKTRLTILKDLKVNDKNLFLDIKDKNNKVIESFNIEINQDTKKINIVLDLKK